MKQLQNLFSNKLYLIFFFGIIFFLLIIIESRSKGDFDIFISASRDLWLGKNIFAERYHEWYHYYYSVFFAILLTPFTFLPEQIRNMIWLLLNVVMVFRIWHIIKQELKISVLSAKLQIFFAIISFLFMMRLLRDNIHTMQVTILMLYFCIEGLNQIFKNKNISGTFLIALGINIKILPIVLLPYLLYRRFWKQGFMITGFYIVLMFVPILLIGYKQNMFLLKEWWNLINPTNEVHIIDVSERSFHGLSTLIPTLLMEKVPDTYALPLKRNIANLNFNTVHFIINLTKLFFISLTLFFLRPIFSKTAPTQLCRFREISYILLAVPLIFPHQQHYAFLFMGPAVIYLLNFWLKIRDKTDVFSNTKMRICVVIIILVFFTNNLNFILGQFQQYYDHYKILTYGAILLIIPLMICNPKYVESSNNPLKVNL